MTKPPNENCQNTGNTSSLDFIRSRGARLCKLAHAGGQRRAARQMSRGVALFEFFDLDLGLVLRVVHGLADVLPSLGGLFGSGFFVRFVDLLRGVLGIAPGFLDRAFYLVDYPFVG